MHEIKTHEVPLLGDQIQVFTVAENDQQVVIKRICENLGIAHQSQLAKLNSAHWAGVTIIVTPDERGCEQPHATIAMDKVPMWLAGINPRKVAPGLRAKIEAYQLQAADVLARYFLGGTGPELGRIIRRYDARLAEIEAACRAQGTELAALKEERRAGRIRYPRVAPEGWLRLVDFAEKQGHRVLGRFQAAEGRRCAALCREHGVEPEKCQPPRGRAANYYPPFVLHFWFAGFLTRNPLEQQMRLWDEPRTHKFLDVIPIGPAPAPDAGREQA